MRKWTVEVNIDGGFFEKKITFVIEGGTSSSALNMVRLNVLNMGFKSHEFQAHII